MTNQNNQLPVEKPASPLPWRVGAGYRPHIKDAENGDVVELGDDGGCNDPDCCGGASYHIELDEQDAAFIVLAANAHAELVAAVREFLDLCPRMSEDDPIAPALVDACRKARSLLRLSPESVVASSEGAPK